MTTVPFPEPDSLTDDLTHPVYSPGYSTSIPDLNPNLTHLRPQQLDIVREAVEASHTSSIIQLQAPPGTGKTLIAEVLRRLIPSRYSIPGTPTPSRAVYTCTTKQLQDQFARDFPHARVVKGRANYLTQSGPLDQFARPLRNPGTDPLSASSVSCVDCTWDGQECRWCHDRMSCSYIKARSDAEMSELAVLNMSYLILDANRGQGRFRQRDLLILDEADLVEHQLLNHTEVRITKTRLAKMGLEGPETKTAGAKKNDWYNWVHHQALPTATSYLATLPLPRSASLQDLREVSATENLIGNLHLLAADLPPPDTLPTSDTTHDKVARERAQAMNWVYDGYEDGEVTFQPVTVGRLGRDLLWPHARRFLLMSGSLLSGDLVATELGMGTNWAFIDVPSLVPIAQRPVHFVPIADMSMKNRGDAWPEMAVGVSSVLARHPNERILVHTVSHQLSEFLIKRLVGNHPGRPIVTYRYPHEKLTALEYYAENEGAVLLGPSVDRGVDLPDDLCRVIVIPQIPYPNIGDKRTEASLEAPGGQLRYRAATIRSIIQGTGRGVRNQDDWAVTYMLDSRFQKLWKESSHLFPLWWREAVNWRFPRHLLMS